MVIIEYSVSELLELWKTFKQAIKEPVIAWLVRLCDMGIDGISLTAVEAKKKTEYITTHLSLRHRLHNMRQYERNQPLMDWLIKSLGKLGYLHLKSP